MNNREIDRSKWKWLGLAKHYILAPRCCWHMATIVGEYIINSVGCRHTKEASDPYERDLTNRESFHSYCTVGDKDRLSFFVTMVFKAEIDGETTIADTSDQLDMESYHSMSEAEEGHVLMCEKWDSGGEMDIQKEHKKHEEREARKTAVDYIDQLIQGVGMTENYYKDDVDIGDVGMVNKEFYIGKHRFSSMSAARSIIQDRIIPALVSARESVREPAESGEGVKVCPVRLECHVIKED